MISSPYSAVDQSAGAIPIVAARTASPEARHLGVFEKDGVQVDVFYNPEGNDQALAVCGGLRPQVFLPASLASQPFRGAEVLAHLLTEAVAIWKHVGPAN